MEPWGRERHRWQAERPHCAGSEWVNAFGEFNSYFPHEVDRRHAPEIGKASELELLKDFWRNEVKDDAV